MKGYAADLFSSTVDKAMKSGFVDKISNNRGMDLIKDTASKAFGAVDKKVGGGLGYKGSSILDTVKNLTNKEGSELSELLTKQHSDWSGSDAVKAAFAGGGDGAAKMKGISDKLKGQISAADFIGGTADGVTTASHMDKKKGLMGMAKEYYTGGDSGIDGSRLFGDHEANNIARKRIATTGGAYAAGAVGARLASGGSLTRNRDGEKDIVGVPLI